MIVCLTMDQVSKEECDFTRRKTERDSIRNAISELSFEELQKLKEKMGLKLYREVMLGKEVKKDATLTMKRENKNRPREISSKIPVSVIRDVPPVKSQAVRDPRFDPLCGEFDKSEFKKSYKFLDEIVQNDLKTLKQQLTTCEDPEEASKLKYLIQRMQNKQREEQRLKKKKEKEREEKGRNLQIMKEGRKPEFMKKSEKRVHDLVEQYKELKEAGRLEKHIERKRKKATQKARKKNLAPE